MWSAWESEKVSPAMEKAKESPTRLLRILMDMFFEPEIMAQSTAKGSQRRGLEALDQTITDCLSKLHTDAQLAKLIFYTDSFFHRICRC